MVKLDQTELSAGISAFYFYLAQGGELTRLRIFFVCEGNSCRSVIAEHLFKDMLWKRGMKDVQVFSRGLDVRHFSTGHYTDRVMKEEYGIDISKHVPRELNKEEGRTADLILTMNKDQKERAIYYGWAQPDRIFTLGEYVGDSEGEDIKDPYGGKKEDYQMTAKRIERYLSKLIEKILPKS
jgi:protein-tyrosine phosphatase